MANYSLQPNTTIPKIEPPSKTTSIPLPTHKIAQTRDTDYTQEQPNETDPKIIIRK
jgi:hypothetical protein